MDHLFTPWRLPYLRSADSPPSECLFCMKPDEPDREAHILHRAEHCYVLVNRFPYNNGHLMVVPFAHVGRLKDLAPETSAEMMELVKLCLQVLEEAYAPEGYNVGANIGSAAGAGVADHIHVHVVPRWSGDTNFITTLGRTRVIPEWIHQVYERLQPFFERLA